MGYSKSIITLSYLAFQDSFSSFSFWQGLFAQSLGEALHVRHLGRGQERDLIVNPWTHRHHQVVNCPELNLKRFELKTTLIHLKFLSLYDLRRIP